MRYYRNPMMHRHPPMGRNKFTRLVFFFTVLVSVILAVTLVVVTLGMFLLNELEVIVLPDMPNLLVPTAIWILSSLVVGIVTAALVSRIPLRPFHFLVEGMNRLAEGDFSIRLHRAHSSLSHKLAVSFNTLATELENTELLRTDFVNNFSHEFKTPIVSILGFAKLLKRDDIPQEKRDEYLDIILSEAQRLTDMSDNVLNLAKIEKQNILTEIDDFNLSEQVRTSVLLLEKKWEQKQLGISFDEHEYHYTGNEELLKQVWINLLDNAIKFAPEGSDLRVRITEEPETIAVSVANQGQELSGETRSRIFEKFYQGDSSHATEGTGLGLAIVHKIVQLHKGEISVDHQDGYNVFTVILPKQLTDTQ